MEQKIQPISVALDTLQISNLVVNLDKDCKMTCFIKNDEGMGYFRSLTMDSETYAEWGDDDTFVMNWALNQLGLTPAN